MMDNRFLSVRTLAAVDTSSAFVVSRTHRLQTGYRHSLATGSLDAAASVCQRQQHLGWSWWRRRLLAIVQHPDSLHSHPPIHPNSRCRTRSSKSARRSLIVSGDASSCLRAYSFWVQCTLFLVVAKCEHSPVDPVVEVDNFL